METAREKRWQVRDASTGPDKAIGGCRGSAGPQGESAAPVEDAAGVAGCRLGLDANVPHPGGIDGGNVAFAGYGEMPDVVFLTDKISAKCLKGELDSSWDASSVRGDGRYRFSFKLDRKGDYVALLELDHAGDENVQVPALAPLIAAAIGKFQEIGPCDLETRRIVNEVAGAGVYAKASTTTIRRYDDIIRALVSSNAMLVCCKDGVPTLALRGPFIFGREVIENPEGANRRSYWHFEPIVPGGTANILYQFADSHNQVMRLPTDRRRKHCRRSDMVNALRNVLVGEIHRVAAHPGSLIKYATLAERIRPFRVNDTPPAENISAPTPKDVLACRSYLEMPATTRSNFTNVVAGILDEFLADGWIESWKPVRRARYKVGVEVVPGRSFRGNRRRCR